MIRGIGGRAGAITRHPHNRASIARSNPTLPLQLPKKLPAFEFWQVLRPPSRPRAAQMAWLVEVSKAAKHLCLELPARPEHLRVATHNGGWRGGGEAQNRPKLKPWRVFSQRTLFRIPQFKLTLPPTSNLSIYTILSIQKRQKRVPF